MSLPSFHQMCQCSGASSSTVASPWFLPRRSQTAHAQNFRNGKLLGRTEAASEQQQQQQLQQQQQQLQPADDPVAKAINFINTLGSKDTRDGVQMHEQPAESLQQTVHQDLALPSSYMALLSVSLLWGSYAPALRYLYSMDDLLTPQVLTAHRTVISAMALVIASLVALASDRYQQHLRLQEQLREEQQQREREEQLRKQWLQLLPTLLLNMLAPFGSSSTTSSRDQQPGSFMARLGGINSSTSTSTNSSSTSSRTRGSSPNLSWGSLLHRFPGRSPTSQTSSKASIVSTENSSSSSSSSSAADAATAPGLAVLFAGLELGTWNFLATAAQACGLNLCTATKAAFLTQTTAVFTPCLALLFGQPVLAAHWVACLAALLGSYCITLDTMGGPLDEKGSLSALTSSSESAQQQLTAAVQPPAAAPNTQVVVAPPLLLEVESVGVTSSTAGSRTCLVRLDSLNDTVDSEVVAATSSQLPSCLSGSSTSSRPAAAAAVVVGPSSPADAPDRHSGSLDQLHRLDSSSSSSSWDVSSTRVLFTGEQQQMTDTTLSADVSSRIHRGPALGAKLQVQQQQQQQQQQQSPNDSQATLAASHEDMPLVQAAGDVTDNSSSSSSPTWGLTGEVYILLACCCYAIATVRLSMLAPGLDPVQLATSKTLTLAAASLVWLLAFGSGAEDATQALAANEASLQAAAVSVPGTGAASLTEHAAQAVRSAVAAWHLPPAFDGGLGQMLLFYSALGPGALATVLQTKGQATVPAAQAQVFYSLTPVWAALLASTCLQGEQMGPLAWLGGCIIVTASIWAAVNGTTNAARSEVTDAAEQ